MFDGLISETREICHFHVYCGAGGGAKGFNAANPRLGSMAGTMRFLGGIDVDPGAIRDFNMMSGAKGTVLDLFDEQQYRDYHGDAYLTAGHYGVLPWSASSNTVSGSACHDNGFFSVADPRLPQSSDRLVCVIRALDDTWHRPFTTLELAAIQTMVRPEDCWDGSWQLDGSSDSDHRKRIGNLVPPDSATAIAEAMGRTLLGYWAGEQFSLSMEKIWVQNSAIPIAISLSVERHEIEDKLS